MEKKFLLPGYLFISPRNVQVTTVLGSCISLCIYDTKLKIGGINHSIYPEVKNEEATCTYGDVANYELLERMRKRYGSNFKDCISYVVGGSGTIRGAILIANRNADLTKKLVRTIDFKRIVFDTGGKKSRKLVFNTFTGEITITTLS